MFDPEREELEAEIVRLRATVEAQGALIAELRAQVDPQAALIEELRSKLEELQARIGRDSANSSLPPSRDRTDRRARRAAEAKERREARKALGQAAAKLGKQRGAEGSTISRREPDRIVVHTPESCNGCGASLADAVVVGKATRQVLEIPTPHLEAIDHVVVSKRCSCGAESRGEFPPEATGAVCWGPRARATGAYLLGRQHLPLERAAEAMTDLFDAPMGEGTLAGLLPEAASGLKAFMATISGLLRDCPVVHADETSVRIKVGLAWVHTVSNPDYTYLAVHERRGIEGIEAIGVLGGYTATIVHDGLASYDTKELAQATHAQCHSHLGRHLDDLAKAPSQTPWACAMKALLASAKNASEEAAAAGLAHVPDAIASPIRRRYDEILTQALLRLPGDVPPPRKHTGGWTNAERQAWNLATRMRRQRDQVLRLLEDTRVPADNNEAERSVRMCKLHDKISGHFRSWGHAEAFATVRSYLQTGAKHGCRAMELLIRLWTPTGAWLPSVVLPDTS